LLTLALTKDDLSTILSPFDLKRLESYANNMLDYHVILDLVPLIADLYFSGRLPLPVSGVQRAILLAIGLQRKGIDDLEKELSLPSGQVMAMFVKVIKKTCTAFRDIQKAAIEKELPKEPKMNGVSNGTEKFAPLEQELNEDLEEAGNEAVFALREKQRELINSLDLQKYWPLKIVSDGRYALGGTDDDWDAALMKGKAPGEGMVISVKSGKDKKRKGESLKEVAEEYDRSQEKKKKHRPH
jgi:N-acetyltransferase 10